MNIETVAVGFEPLEEVAEEVVEVRNIRITMSKSEILSVDIPRSGIRALQKNSTTQVGAVQILDRTSANKIKTRS